ncbi:MULTISPECIES: hypothetical protein [unclassified Paracoccus (in: a-proteobacteria)]|uniref:hypothetical protein n=1 Tax=unclassified Paracoccus (in: a-proteobacteria) TaxID=2688777 RepID=UPI0016003FC0|nr:MULTISPECIES: hypothetical protein [unclassified Paracoccus (in: a-proteobacteria)]MBB1490757.1 hypothetical protein [Paracoccus sp. MC1854]MBB1497400.1 hypothetical protein [Paracoccus sp. MC1862]QQO45891.1 hypothetical protein JGR78_06200 [Paracoccus sp. MC1862]
MAPPGNSRSSTGVNPWLLVLAAAAVILVAVLFFMAAPVPEPTPLPDSPAAQGTAGEPAGETGDAPQPGAPGEAPPNPDVAPGTGTDTTRG